MVASRDIVFILATLGAVGSTCIDKYHDGINNITSMVDAVIFQENSSFNLTVIKFSI